jgi:hypothetical protein
VRAGAKDPAAQASPAVRSGGRLALTRVECARALGISIDSFERHVQPELRLIRRGKLRLVAVRELERWIEENSANTIEPRWRR